MQIILLEPVNHRRSNRLWSGKADHNRICSCNHRSIQSKGFIVAQHGPDVVTAGFKHSSADYERASVVRDLQNVSHYWAPWGLRGLTPFAALQHLFCVQQHDYVIHHSSSYLFTEGGVKNCTVTLRPIGNESGLPSKPITASRISRSLLSDGSPVEMFFRPIIADILTTDPLSLFPSRASAWITTFCPSDTLSTSLSSISALMCREEVSARLNNGRGVTVLKDSPRLAKTLKTVPSIGARIEHFSIRSWTVRARPSAASTSASARALSSRKGGAASNSSVRTAPWRLASATPRSRTACS